MTRTYSKRYPTLDQRFWSKVDPCRTDGCIRWVASTDSKGYGQLKVDGKLTRAHHFLVGKPPKGFDWGHTCHDRDKTCSGGKTCEHRLCVAREHLTLMTHLENVQAGRKPSTHCPQGHELTKENVYRSGTDRWCKICKRNREKEKRRARRLAS